MDTRKTEVVVARTLKVGQMITMGGWRCEITELSRNNTYTYFTASIGGSIRQFVEVNIENNSIITILKEGKK